jgi:hypothetical protein
VDITPTLPIIQKYETAYCYSPQVAVNLHSFTELVILTIVVTTWKNDKIFMAKNAVLTK